MAHIFECRACFRWSLNALTSVHRSQAPFRSRIDPHIILRDFHVAGFRRQFEHYGADRAANAPVNGSYQHYQRNKAQKSALRDQHTTNFDKPANATSKRATRMGNNYKALSTELKYLRDPVKLADHIRYVLKQDDAEKALALVRLSSVALANVVSWNHVIDWFMKSGKTKTAMETYNEMKKRGQKPDSHTYLLLLRGLGDHAHHPGSLGRALSLYHAISAPKSSVAPTIIHTNAVLKVCARAGDMESIWHITSNLPERGPHAADGWTFCIILNNMRVQALTGGVPDESAEQAAVRKEALIIDGRRLWEDITKRWRAGDLLVDEELVCAMGRLLLVGARPRDWDDVLSLLQQTMGLPRMVPRLGSAARLEAPVPRIRAPHTPANMKNDATGQDVDALGDARPGAEFNIDVFGGSKAGELTASGAHRRTTVVKGSRANVHAKPGNSTLSLVLDSCLHMAAKQPAVAYWDLLTNPDGAYGIAPDLDNMHMYLRILRFSHSSREALDFLRDDIPAAGLKPSRKTFHLAMSACVRDFANPNVVETASRILDHAMNTLAEPGALTFRLYLDTVLASKPDFKTQIQALRRLEPGTVSLRSLINFGSAAEARHAMDEREGKVRTPAQKLAFAAEVQREKNEALELMKRMVQQYDRVLGLCKDREVEMGSSHEEQEMLRQHKAKLSAFVQRHRSKQIQDEVKSKGWRPTSPKADWTVRTWSRVPSSGDRRKGKDAE